MKNYDVIVIGSGSGSLVSDEAASRGLQVALIDKGPLIGGTCLNWGCIPSKMLIYVADRIMDIAESVKFGINAEIKDIDFSAVMNRMRKSRKQSQLYVREGIDEQRNIDFYEDRAYFVNERTLSVGGIHIEGKKIFIASGSRPFIPPIKGLENVNYLTNESVLELEERPDSLIIVGGGYIAVEYGHFFAAMGTEVTILEMADRLVLSEEPEIAAVLQSELSKRMNVYTGFRAEEVFKNQNGISIIALDTNGKKKGFSARKLMMAVGRRSNADLLSIEKTYVELDKKGFIKVNENLETSHKNIYAIGDANGQQMFTHMANREAATVVQNVFYGTDIQVDYSVVPHAVYSRPQIASVGLKEDDARETHDILLGKMKYFDTAKGEAMMENEGYIKVIVEKETEKVLGCHIIGPYAPEIIQELVNAVSSGGHIREINDGIHIHPALSELIPTVLDNLE